MSVATYVLADNEHRNQITAALQDTVGTPISHSHTLRGLEWAQQFSDGTFVASGRIGGVGSINADNIIIEGQLSPGNSPGCISFSGNVTFNFSATYIAEIGGLTPCTEHDRIDVGNQLTINSATLEVILINGLDPQFEDTFDIMNWGSITGTFGTIDTSAATLSYPLVWDTSQLYLTGELIAGVQQIADGDLAPWNSPDGQINAADVLVATQLTLGMRTPGALQYAHGDMNLDDVIDIADLLLIQRAVLQ